MARFAKKLGTIPARYMFEMTLHKVELHVPYDVQVSVILKRGKHRTVSFMLVDGKYKFFSSVRT